MKAPQDTKNRLRQYQICYGDYLVIPRGTIYQLEFDTPDNRLFIVESFSPDTSTESVIAMPIWATDGTFALLRARYQAPAIWKRMMRKATFKILIKKQGLDLSLTYMAPILSILLAGMVFIIPGHFPYTILNRLPAACTNHHRCIKPSRAITL
jgi:hypothetical protein